RRGGETASGGCGAVAAAGGGRGRGAGGAGAGGRGGRPGSRGRPGAGAIRWGGPLAFVGRFVAAGAVPEVEALAVARGTPGREREAGDGAQLFPQRVGAHLA